LRERKVSDRAGEATFAKENSEVEEGHGAFPTTRAGLCAVGGTLWRLLNSKFPANRQIDELNYGMST